MPRHASGSHAGWWHNVHASKKRCGIDTEAQEYDCNAKTLGYAWSISTYRRTVPQNRREARVIRTMPNSAATLHASFTPWFARTKGGRSCAVDPEVSRDFGDSSTTAPV
jgi:hypothetical protein